MEATERILKIRSEQFEHVWRLRSRVEGKLGSEIDWGSFLVLAIFGPEFTPTGRVTANIIAEEARAYVAEKKELLGQLEKEKDH